MKDRLFLEVRRFFSSLTDEFAPYLLALSGGPDSMALFHCLQKLGLPFTVLYIDHGWREESASEMHTLREMAGRSGAL
jgi:tRNA(Ile)-lysidine synthase